MEKRYKQKGWRVHGTFAPQKLEVGLRGVALSWWASTVGSMLPQRLCKTQRGGPAPGIIGYRNLRVCAGDFDRPTEEEGDMQILVRV